MRAPVELARAEATGTVEIRKLFDAVVETIDKRFFDTKRLEEIDWKGRVQAAWPEVARAKTAAEAVPRLNALLAELKTSHTQVFTADEPEYYILADVFGAGDVAAEFWASPVVVAGIGIYTAKFDGRDHVTAVLEGSPADKAGLRVGDEVVAVDGASYAAVGSFRGKAGRAAAMTIRKRVDGPASEVAVPVVLMQPTQAFERATAASARVFERGAKKIGYVHIWQMRNEQALATALACIDGARQPAERQRERVPASCAYANRAAADGSRRPESNERLPALDALIVDDRVKVGGSPSVGTQFLNVLSGERGGAYRANGRNGKNNDPPAASFRGRSALLINGGTRSAAEMFAHGYAVEKLGPLIGARTAGAVSAAQVQRLPGGLLMYVAVSGITIEGVRLEGVGVAPTMPVERPIPYSDGADPVLEAALDYLAKQ